MKTLRSAAVVLGAVLLSGGVLLAGQFHTGSSLTCSDCHVMHYSQDHGYAPDGSGPFTPLANGPNTRLLRNDVNELCLACHDSDGGAPDVFEADDETVVGYNSGNRQAGALNDTLSAGPYFDATGHTLGSTDLAPGGTFQALAPDGLECTHCHNPHGQGGSTTDPYRNLSGDVDGAGPHVSVTYETGGATNAADVYWPNVGFYDVADMDLQEPSASESGFGLWCQRCHTDFHGQEGSAAIGGPDLDFVRHPTAGVDIGEGNAAGHSDLDIYREGNSTTKVAFVKVMSSTGVWPVNGVTPGVLPADLTPTCITCHKAHGNQNAFGLIYMGEAGGVDEEGTAGGTYNNLCNQCHTQGL